MRMSKKREEGAPDFADFVDRHHRLAHHGRGQCASNDDRREERDGRLRCNVSLWRTCLARSCVACLDDR